MKKFLLALPILLLSCSFPQEPQGKSVDKLDGYTPNHLKHLEIKMVSEEIEHGLYKITIDDTVHVLLYRGVESCTMIQVK